MLPTKEKTTAVLRICATTAKLPFQEQRDELLRRLYGHEIVILDWDATGLRDHCFLEELKKELARLNTDRVHVDLCELDSNREQHMAIIALARWTVTFSPEVVVPIFADANGTPCNPAHLGFVYRDHDWQVPTRLFGFATLEKVTPQGRSTFNGLSLIY